SRPDRPGPALRGARARSRRPRGPVRCAATSAGRASPGGLGCDHGVAAEALLLGERVAMVDDQLHVAGADLVQTHTQRGHERLSGEAGAHPRLPLLRSGCQLHPTLVVRKPNPAVAGWYAGRGFTDAP